MLHSIDKTIVNDLEYLSNKQMFDQTAVKTAYSIYSKYSKYCSNKYTFKKIMLYGYKLPAFVNPKYFIEKNQKVVIGG